MIRYEHGRWGLFFLGRLKGSVFPKALVWAVPCSLVSGGFFYLKTASGYEDNRGSSVAMTAVSAFVSILGFLVVFRSNQAWARFWEGADLLQQARGQWVSAMSSLFAFTSTADDKKEKVSQMMGCVARLMSLMYSEALSNLCDGLVFEHLDLEGLDEQVLNCLADEPSAEVRTELVLHWIQRTIMNNVHAGVVNAAPPIVSRVFNELSAGAIKVKQSRKVKEIQFPFHYAQMLGVMLIVYSCGVPAMSAYIMETYWGTMGSTFLNIFVLWCTNYLSVEIEQPFGNRPNDLPLYEEMAAMNSTLRMLLTPHAMSAPQFDGDMAATVVMDNCVAKLSALPEKPGVTKPEGLRDATRSLARLKVLRGDDSASVDCSWRHESKEIKTRTPAPTSYEEACLPHALPTEPPPQSEGMSTEPVGGLGRAAARPQGKQWPHAMTSHHTDDDLRTVRSMPTLAGNPSTVPAAARAHIPPAKGGRAAAAGRSPAHAPPRLRHEASDPRLITDSSPVSSVGAIRADSQSPRAGSASPGGPHSRLPARAVRERQRFA